MAAGTRTAPAATAAATARRITMRFIDASGDKGAEELYVPVAATAANIETYIAAYQAATQASIYEYDDTLIRDGDADPDNAGTDQRNSIAAGINMLFKNATTRATNNSRLVAPIEAVLQGNQDIPLLSATELSALIVAELAITTGFTFREAQYTERRERKNNQKVR